jgi:hypothetical protein
LAGLVDVALALRLLTGLVAALVLLLAAAALALLLVGDVMGGHHDLLR